MNREIAEKVARRISPMVRPGATVAILGLSYKPFSHVIEESQAIYIAKLLSGSGFRVVAFDPMSSEMELEEIRSKVVVLDSIEACLSQAEAVLITTPDPSFKALNAEDFMNQWAQVLVFDFWRILEKDIAAAQGIKYIGIGLSSDDASNTKRLNELWWGKPGDALVNIGE